jgi:hypothetical protein
MDFLRKDSQTSSLFDQEDEVIASCVICSETVNIRKMLLAKHIRLQK